MEVHQEPIHQKFNLNCNSIDATSTTSDPDSNMETEDESLVNLSPTEVTPRTFVGLASPAHVQPDLTRLHTPPLDSESNETLVAHNKSQRDAFPPPLTTIDAPDNVNEPRAMIDPVCHACSWQPLLFQGICLEH